MKVFITTEKRKYGPYDGVRISGGRFLEVLKRGEWFRLAFSIPRDKNPKYKFTRGNTGAELIEEGRYYHFWRFGSGDDVRWDAEDLEFGWTGEPANGTKLRRPSMGAKGRVRAKGKQPGKGRKPSKTGRA